MFPTEVFFSSARYSSFPVDGAQLQKGWSIVAAFDADNYNLYHYMNKLHAAFVARLYELGGLRERSLTTPQANILDELISPESEFTDAYLFRPRPTSWQQNYGEICLGNRTKFHYAPQVDVHSSILPICFEKAIIPGAALYVSDGVFSSALFRELAARVKGVRVTEQERNLITVFLRSENRQITNHEELIRAIQHVMPSMQVTTVQWNEDVDFKIQALHMARTRIMISTHGSVINHNAFMELSGVVIEINTKQFSYTLDSQAVLQRGNHYLRYQESLQNTRYQASDWGQNPFPNLSTRQCMRVDECIRAARDADVKVNISRFIDYFQEEALPLIA